MLFCMTERAAAFSVAEALVSQEVMAGVVSLLLELPHPLTKRVSKIAKAENFNAFVIETLLLECEFYTV